MPRVFFALQPTSAQSEALVADVAPLVAQLEGQPVPATNVHATLCFVGSVEGSALAALRAAAAQVRGRHVTLRFDALDVWEKPQILCAIGAEDGTARDLSTALADAASGAGCAPDRKPFRAHLTLARKVRRSMARNFEWPRALAPFTLTADHFVLMESRRVEQRSTYSVVESWPLDEK